MKLSLPIKWIKEDGKPIAAIVRVPLNATWSIDLYLYKDKQSGRKLGERS